MKNNLGLFLAKRARLHPQREALVEVERERRFRYDELDTRCNRTAQALRALGVAHGDRVALLQMNGVEFVESYYACAKLGAVAVPLNWRLVPAELEFILGDAGATVLIYDAEFDATAAALRERTTPLRHWIRVGAAAGRPEFALDYDAWQAAASSEPPRVVAGDGDDLFLMYTSGTTGLPKGVLHTHDSVIWASLTINLTADMRVGDRYLQMLPLFHVGALTPLNCCIHRGTTIVLMRAFDAASVFGLIAAERITTGLGVPAMLRAMLLASDPREHDLSTLRWLMSGAAPVPVSLIEAYAKLGIEIQQVYGLTESCGPACLIGSDDAVAKAGSTGPPFFHTDVRVVDEAGRDVAPGEVGEVIIRGRHLMKGYWNRPDATAEAIRGGWLHSGDLATVDAEGFVYIQDRKKDMIITGGENVYPAEIESVLLELPGVVDAAVIGVPSERWGESPAALIVKQPGAALDAPAVLAHCQGKLARYKIPKVVEFIDDVPRNPSGKILKRVLRDRFPGPAPE